MALAESIGKEKAWRMPGLPLRLAGNGAMIRSYREDERNAAICPHLLRVYAVTRYDAKDRKLTVLREGASRHGRRRRYVRSG
jgi:hypothetical protein